MPEFLSCIAFVLFLVPMVACLVLWARIHELQQRLNNLDTRMGALARDLLQRPRATAPAPAAQTPAVPLAEPPAAPPKPVAPPPMPRQPYPPVAVPHVAPPAPANEKLHQRLEEVRKHAHSAPVAPTPHTPPAPAHPAMPAPAAEVPIPPVYPPVIPAAKPAPKTGKGWEAYIFTVGFVVLGAIILALAAIFMVKMAIDAGWFNAQRRDIAAFVAGLALLALGQWRRKFEGFWSQGATAAGIVTLFATFFAATTLHHFLQPVHGFILLAGITATAVAMSLQNWSGRSGDHNGGILIAALGLLGGFITPILVNTGTDNVPGLFGYLILLHVGLIATTRLRGWSILAAASVIFSSLWLILWVLFKPWQDADGPIYGVFMLGMVVSLVFATVTQPEKWHAPGTKEGLPAMTLTWLAVALGLFASCLLLMKSNFTDLQWAFFACLIAGSFFLGRLRPRLEAMPWLASFLVLGMLMAWRSANYNEPASESVIRYLAAFGVATALAAYGCLWKSLSPWRWGLLSVLLTLAYVGVAYWLIPDPHRVRPDEWAFLPLASAVALAALTVPLFLQRRQMASGEQTLSIFAHGVLALLVIAPPMALSDANLTAAWCALLPLTALAVWRLRLPGLLQGFLAVLCFVVVRGIMVTTVLDASGEGYTLFWNPVVWSYGSILAAMALSAWLIERVGELPERLRGVVPAPEALSAMLHVGATAAAFALLTLEVRWGFHGGKLNDLSALLVERGTFGFAWLLLGAGLVWLGTQLKREILVRCGEVVGILGMIYSIFVLVVLTNPLWWGDDVGTWPVFNVLVYVYGVPAAVCGLLAWLLTRDGRHATARAAGVVGLILLFMMVSLQVRQGYAGPFLGLPDGDITSVTFPEIGTYAIVWMALGAACLAIGLRWGKDLLHKAGVVLASGGLMYAIVIAGVFMSPVLFHQSVGSVPIFNWLLYAYGLPLLLALLVAWMAHPRTAPLWNRTGATADRTFAGLTGLMHAGIAALAFILLTTEIRQAFQHQFLNALQMDFVERGTYTLAWLLLGGGLLLLGDRFGLTVARIAGLAITTFSLFWVFGICTLITNPLWMPQLVGETRVFNWLLYHYGLPAAGTAILAHFLWRRGIAEQIIAWIAGIISLLLIFTTVTLEVQQFFRGDHLALGPGPAGEFTAYSLAWAALGAAYLVVGILRRSTLLRWASLAMMLLTIFKVFLFDMHDLQGFERVLSFAGLGISLMALAFVYQRFVFRREPAAELASAAPEDVPVE